MTFAAVRRTQPEQKKNNLKQSGEKGPHHVSAPPAFVSGYITEYDCQLTSHWKSNLLLSDPDDARMRTDAILHPKPCL